MPVAANAQTESVCDRLPEDKPDLAGIDIRDGTGIVGLEYCVGTKPAQAKERKPAGPEDARSDNRFVSNLYAQWRIRALDGEPRPRLYSMERQSALIRFFVGKNKSMLTSVRIQVKDPNIMFVIPLSSFGYQGRVGEGESWTTSLVSDDQSLPFFRIEPSTSAAVSVSAKSTSAIEVKAAGPILNALRTLSSVVTPGGSLVTSLNRETLQQSATALDSALSSIWSESIDEQHTSAVQISNWRPDARFLIQIVMPDFARTRDDRPKGAKREDRPVRSSWYLVELSCARLSIFDAKESCTSDWSDSDYDTGLFSYGFRAAAGTLRNRITPQQVNNYQLASGKSVHQQLSDQPWFGAFLRAIDPPERTGATRGGTEAQTPPTPTAPPAAAADASANANADSTAKTENKPATSTANDAGRKSRTEQDYSALCQSIVDSLYSAGLSPFDARIGLWATVVGTSDFVGITHRFQNNDVCWDLLPPSLNERWYFHDEPDPPKPDANADAKKPVPPKKPARKK